MKAKVIFLLIAYVFCGALAGDLQTAKAEGGGTESATNRIPSAGAQSSPASIAIQDSALKHDSPKSPARVEPLLLLLLGSTLLSLGTAIKAVLSRRINGKTMRAAVHKQ